MDIRLSKSQYVKGHQCQKALWISRHYKELIPKIDPDKQARFDMGKRVGMLAQRCFESGMVVDHPYWEIDKAVNTTNDLVASGHNVIFEATATHPANGCYSRIDILKRTEDGDGWDLIEVKSSTSVKDYHINDLAFQYYVFSNAGYKIDRCMLMYIDKEYVRNGDLDPKVLFKHEEITNQAIDKQNEIEETVAQLIDRLSRLEEPKISIGAHCFAPFECELRYYCWKHVPEYSVYDVFQKSQAESLDREYGPDLRNLPADLHPTGTKQIDVQSYLSGQAVVNPEGLKAFVEQLQYPLFFLDYETIVPTLPLFDESRPYQQIPFQFSLHIQEHKDAELKHIEFLHKEQTDPRESFVEQLLNSCGDEGHVIVYYKPFEMSRNRELAEHFPQHASKFHSLNDRVIDLWDPFKQRALYHPDQNGSASIKAALPCFTDLSYEDLNIGQGSDAMRLYEAFVSGEIGVSAQEPLWENLREYCQQDTFAMKRLLDVIYEHAYR